MNRRTLIIIASVIVLLGLAVGAYFLFFASSSPSLTNVPNPFGTSGDRPYVEPTIGDGGPVQGAGTLVAPRLIRIANGPVAKGVHAAYLPGVPEVASSTASTTVAAAPPEVEVRYIERQSGNVFLFRFHDRVLTRIGNKTLPGVQDAVWAKDGSQAFVRFLTRNTDGGEQVDTYALPAEGGDGYFLEKGLEAVRVSSSTVLSLLPNTTGSIASLSDVAGTNVRTLFTSALSSLVVEFAGNDVLATTKASSGLDGYAFLVRNSVFTRLLGPYRGLATLPSPSGSSVLFSYTERGKIYTRVLDLKTGEVIPLPLTTLAEKCVWAPGERALYCGIPTNLAGDLPDEWYQGARSFTDRLWNIDLDTRLATLVVDPATVADVAIDAVALTVDPGSDVLLFTNRIDGALWGYDL